MELSKIDFTVTILIYLTAIAISEEFEIFRVRPSGEDGWIFARDSFKIPPSLCNQGGMNCAHFNAHTKSACYCSCPYREATFMFDGNDWRCLSNLRARQLLGYHWTYYFHYLTERQYLPIRLAYFNDCKRVSLDPTLKRCRVHSTWDPVRILNVTSRKFHLTTQTCFQSYLMEILEIPLLTFFS